MYPGAIQNTIENLPPDKDQLNLREEFKQEPKQESWISEKTQKNRLSSYESECSSGKEGSSNSSAEDPIREHNM